MEEELFPFLGLVSEPDLHLESECGCSCAVTPGQGCGGEDGSTRKNITIWMEDTRARVLTKALEQYLDQKARPGMIL